MNTQFSFDYDFSLCSKISCDSLQIDGACVSMAQSSKGLLYSSKQCL